MMNPAALVIWDMISVPLKSAGDLFCTQLSFHCTLVGWKIQSIICSLRYAVRGEKTLHATNQPATRPAATDKKKDTAGVTAGGISAISGQTSRWATSRQSYCQRRPEEHQPTAQTSRSRAAEVWMHEQTDALQCKQPHVNQSDKSRQSGTVLARQRLRMSGSVLLQVASWVVHSRPILSLLECLNKDTPSTPF